LYDNFIPQFMHKIVSLLYFIQLGAYQSGEKG